SVISTNPSGGSGEMLRRAGAGGDGLPKEPPISDMSVMSAKPSLLMSAGQASVPHLSSGLVPMMPSAVSLQPSLSSSLSQASPMPSASVSSGGVPSDSRPEPKVLSLPAGPR